VQAASTQDPQGVARGPRRDRRPLRAAVRFAASVMAVSGGLLIADAVVTLLWQEPLSALLAAREQTALAAQLPASPPPDGSLPPALLAALAHRTERGLETGDAVGRISFPTLDRSFVVVEGTDVETLRRGPGRYPRTGLPGSGTTTAIAGHRTTYGAPFRDVDDLAEGARIELVTPYGRFDYRVERTRIVAPTATWVIRRVAYDRLVLTACHPLYSADERIVVFARLERSHPTFGS
jgi:sortase A